MVGVIHIKILNEMIMLKKLREVFFYSSNVEFSIFDIYIKETNGNGFYVNKNDFFKLMRRYNLDHSLELFKGTLEECLKYNNFFESNIYKYYNLPKIENNICEGVVISLVIPIMNNNSRIIFKNKNDNFKEKSEHRKIKIKKELSSELKILINDISRFITKNRLDNVISKIGEIKLKDFSQIIRDFIDDVINDYKKEYSSLNTISKQGLKIIRKYISKESSLLIKEYFKSK